MKKNLIWQIFFSVLSIIVVIFTSLLSWDLYRYYQLKCHVSVEHMHAAVKKLGSNRFSIELDYLYQVNGHKYSCTNELKNLVYKNTWLAAQKARFLEEQGVQIWFDPKKPHLGVVGKSFPYKRLFSTGTLWGVLIYFWFLSRYIFKKNLT